MEFLKQHLLKLFLHKQQLILFLHKQQLILVLHKQMLYLIIQQVIMEIILDIQRNLQMISLYQVFNFEKIKVFLLVIKNLKSIVLTQFQN